MQLSIVCIKRPVLAWVMTLIVIVIGIVSFNKLPINYYPKFEHPVVTIETGLQGSSAEVIENSITKHVEDAMASIDGVDFIQSTSMTDSSKVTVWFLPHKDLEHAVNDIRDKLFKIRQNLPKDHTPSTITRSATTGSSVITLALMGPKYEVGDLAEFARNEIQNELESIPGVAQVMVQGAGLYVMHIYLDPVKLATHNVSVKEVSLAVEHHNFEKPAGYVRSGDKEYVVTIVSNLQKPVQFENMGVAERNGHIIKIRDIGYVKMEPEDKKSRSRFNGEKVATVTVTKQSTSNPLTIADTVKTKMPVLTKKLKEGMSLTIASDNTSHIRTSIDQVYRTIFEAILFVTIVVLLFLQSLRASIIPLVTIPVSLIGTFTVMNLLGFSINIFTLVAVVLAIGLVVDDAIVVLENIYRYIEKGLNPLQAAYKGIKEISFAIIAMTLTLTAVYAPTTLISEGFQGKMMVEFSITLATAVLISGFAALTLSPMMCSRLLRPHGEEKNKFEKLWVKYLPMEVWLERLEIFYEKILSFALDRKYQIIAGGLVFSLISGILYLFLPATMMPPEERGTIYITGYTPQSSTIDFTERKVLELDKLLSEMPEVERRWVGIDSSSHFKMSLVLKNGVSSGKIAKQIEKKFNEVPGLGAHIESDSDGGGGKTITFVIRGNKDIGQLETYSNLIRSELSRTGIVEGMPTTSARPKQEQYVITVNPKVDLLKIDPFIVAENIELFRGKIGSKFKKDNALYDVMIEVPDEKKRNIEDLGLLSIKATHRNQDIQIPLSEIVDIEPRMGYPLVNHYNRNRSYDQRYVLSRGASTADAVQKIQKAAEKIIPTGEGVDLAFTQDTREYMKHAYTTFYVFILALVFIYLIMAAQFESWIDPFIIILSVPLALAGGVIAIGLTSQPLITMYGQIGFITLIGLITKHGIMMVDFANTLQAEGLSIRASILRASQLRLRPILMTTFAMILGAFPLLFAQTTVKDGLRELGLVIMGGLTVGTFLTLFVIPCVYVVIKNLVVLTIGQRRKLILEEN